MPEETIDIARYEALEKQLVKKFGENFITCANDVEPVEKLPTNLPTLDYLLGGGLPYGRLIEMYGRESSGKSSLANYFIKLAQAHGIRPVYIDAEHAFSRTYAEQCGVDLDNLMIHEPDTAEEAVDCMVMLTESPLVQMVILDSVAALTPKNEYDRAADETGVGELARILGRKIKQICGQISKTGCIFIAINQLRDSIQGPASTPGGKSIKYHASIRLNMVRIENIGTPEPIGIVTQIKVDKNKVGSPFRKGTLSIYFPPDNWEPGDDCHYGVDNVADIISAALVRGICKKAGTWFSYGEVKVQGMESFRKLFINNEELFNQLIQEMYGQTEEDS